MNTNRILTKIQRTIATFLKENNGASAVLIAFLAMPIMGAVGLSVDLGRAYVLKSKLSTALDAAGLAAGRVIFDDDATVLADAQKYFDANFPPDYMGANVSNLQISWDAERENIELLVHADLNTTFMNVMGQPSLSVGTRTVINRVNRGMELALVLDNTGSMARNNSNNYDSSHPWRIEVLQDAATDLIEILYGNNETQNNFWISVIPYVTQVNVGWKNISFLKSADQTNILSSSASIFKADTYNQHSVSGSTVYGWKGCVEARDNLNGGTIDTMDTPPNSEANRFNPYFYTHRTDNDWVADGVDQTPSNPTDWNNFFNSVGQGPNSGCPTPILPLTAEKSTVQAAIDAMRPWYSGGTMGKVGMVWGWRSISPDWRGLWADSDSTLPLDYDEPLVDKVVIMMTDGENLVFSHASNEDGYDYNTYGSHDVAATGVATSKHNQYGRLTGYSSYYRNLYKDLIDAKFSQTCEAMKAEGIIVYTILFKDGNENLYRNCATSPAHFYNSPTNEALAEAFQSIGQELSNLRIAE
jgi:Flp pilus assembly protein TadG